MCRQLIENIRFDCSECNSPLHRDVSVLTECSSMITSFWCNHCRQPQAFRLFFKKAEDGDALVVYNKKRLDAEALNFNRVVASRITPPKHRKQTSYPVQTHVFSEKVIEDVLENIRRDYEGAELGSATTPEETD